MASLGAVSNTETAIRHTLTTLIREELEKRDLANPDALAKLLQVFPSGAEVVLSQLNRSSSPIGTLFRVADALGLAVTLQGR